LPNESKQKCDLGKGRFQKLTLFGIYIRNLI